MKSIKSVPVFLFLLSALQGQQTPIENPGDVDKRRAQYALGSLESYLKNFSR